MVDGIVNEDLGEDDGVRSVVVVAQREDRDKGGEL